MTWNKHGSHINFTLALVQFILGFYLEGACTWHSTTNNHPKSYIPSYLYWSGHSEENGMTYHQENHNLYTTKNLWSLGPKKLISGAHLVLSLLYIVIDLIMQELWFFNSPCTMYYRTPSTNGHWICTHVI